MNKEEVKQFLRNKQGYIKFGSYKLSTILDCDQDLCYQALGEIRKEIKKQDLYTKNLNFKLEKSQNNKTSYDVFRDSFKVDYEINNEFVNLKKISRIKVKKNVLIIGDLHEPFCLEGYLEHCIETYYKYNCNEVVFIGDIIDNHASSYHETDPDGYSAGQELKLAISNIQKWYQSFPKATVIIGNHDRLIMRKAYSAGVSKMWIKDYAEVLGVPDWNFTESIEIDDVLYIHGEGGEARARVRRDLQSIVQGHLHTKCYTDWIVGSKFKLFGLQVGCGIDHTKYAMAYAKENAKPAIACAVVLNGETPINIMMNL